MNRLEMIDPQTARALLVPYSIDEVDAMIREAAQTALSVELSMDRLTLEQRRMLDKHGFKVEMYAAAGKFRVSWGQEWPGPAFCVSGRI